MDDMYREVILEHYKHPHNAGTLEQPDDLARRAQPALRRPHADRPADRRWHDHRCALQGRGCAISQASASLLTDEIMGKTVEQVRAFSKDDMLDLIGIPLG